MFSKAPPPPCPRVAILADAANVVKFRPGEGRDLTDIEYDGEILSVNRTCELVDKGAALEATIYVEIAASRGPAAAAQPTVPVPYFVAVVERLTQKIVAREAIAASVDIPAGRRRAGAREELLERIPLGAGKSGSDYEILVGFDLTPDQLAYNRKQRGY